MIAFWLWCNIDTRNRFRSLEENSLILLFERREVSLIVLRKEEVVLSYAGFSFQHNYSWGDPTDFLESFFKCERRSKRKDISLFLLQKVFFLHNSSSTMNCGWKLLEPFSGLSLWPKGTWSWQSRWGHENPSWHSLFRRAKAVASAPIWALALLPQPLHTKEKGKRKDVRAKEWKKKI